MFLPTTRKEMDKLGWDSLDIILVSGESLGGRRRPARGPPRQRGGPAQVQEAPGEHR